MTSRGELDIIWTSVSQLLRPCGDPALVSAGLTLVSVFAWPLTSERHNPTILHLLIFPELNRVDGYPCK